MIPEVPMGVLKRSASFRSKAFLKPKPAKKRSLSPGERKYREDFNDYLDVKKKREGFIENKQKNEKADWDNFTKGLDSPNRKATALKQQSPGRFQPLEFEVAKPKVQHEELLHAFNDADKEAFVRLRILYNSLDPVFELLTVEWKQYGEYYATIIGSRY